MSYDEAADLLGEVYGGWVFWEDPEWTREMIDALMEGDIDPKEL